MGVSKGPLYQGVMSTYKGFVHGSGDPHVGASLGTRGACGHSEGVLRAIGFKDFVVRRCGKS